MRKTVSLFLLAGLLSGSALSAQKKKDPIYKPWSHGKLQVNEQKRFLSNGASQPFFWLGDTGWLLPERLDRDEAAYYLEGCHKAGFNVVQVQTTNAVPTMNVYGRYSLVDGFNFAQFPYFTRVPDQTVIASPERERYDRLIATRGDDYLLVYNHTGYPMSIDLTRISGKRKKAWWYDPQNGAMNYIGEYDNGVADFVPAGGYGNGNDQVLVITDASKNYVKD